MWKLIDQIAAFSSSKESSSVVQISSQPALLACADLEEKANDKKDRFKDAGPNSGMEVAASGADQESDKNLAVAEDSHLQTDIGFAEELSLAPRMESNAEASMSKLQEVKCSSMQYFVPLMTSLRAACKSSMQSHL